MRDSAFDPFGNELLVRGAGLSVSVSAALLHRAKAAHAAIHLVAAPLVENEIPGGLIGAGEERADHDGARARGDRLGDVARVLHSAIGDDGYSGAVGDFGAIPDGGHLRNSNSRDDA